MGCSRVVFHSLPSFIRNLQRNLKPQPLILSAFLRSKETGLFALAFLMAFRGLFLRSPLLRSSILLPSWLAYLLVLLRQSPAPRETLCQFEVMISAIQLYHAA